MSNKRKYSSQRSVVGGHPGVDSARHDLDRDENKESRDDAHFQQLYAKAPDFKTLARMDADFAAVVKGRREVDFNDPAALMQLTKTLLKLDFGIGIELPDDRLCPPVANRHNYILWLKRLLDTSSYRPIQKDVIGLDIGTGASCIYPLLACTQRPWSFLATDIDEKSLEYAKANVKRNGLEDRIDIIPRTPDEPLIPSERLESITLDFVMNNPPFYASAEDLLASAANKSRPPHSACTGAEVEMVTTGGEVAFVTRIIEESLVLRDKVRWYTAMLGFLGSVSRIIERLREEDVDNIAVTELVQGSKTRRWVVGWSFGAMRPANDVVRGIASIPKNILPPKTHATIISLPVREQVGVLADGFANAIGQLDLLQWNWDKERLEGVGRAPDVVWNRAWRRMKMRREKEGGPSPETGQASFGFRVSVHVGWENVDITVDWLEGHDAAAFESFQGYLKTTVESLWKQK